MDGVVCCSTGPVLTGRLSPQFDCCGATFHTNWEHSEWRHSPLNTDPYRKVPDSCCKTEVPGCGQRNHPSNINQPVRLHHV